MSTSTSRYPDLGEVAPDFTLSSLEGNPISLSSYQGKKVIVFMWASWWACREQLPVWQEFYQKHQDAGVEVLSVAIDAQGAEKARPYAEKASATFPTVVDEDNLLSQAYGFKAIPNALFIDEQGVLRYKMYGGFDIRKPELKGAAEEWAATGSIGGTKPTSEVPTSGLEHSKATALFHRGMELYRQGRVQEALALWREGVTLEPDNYVIRKQVWAVEYPEKFYGGDVDFAWQKEQMEKGL